MNANRTHALPLESPSEPVTRTSDEDFVAAERIRHVGTDFHLNPVFVESIGRERADEFRDTLIRVGSERRHHSRAEVRSVLGTALDDIGIRLSPVELDSFADEIARSNSVTAHSDPAWSEPEL